MNRSLSVLNYIGNFFKPLFTFDLRSLSLMRIGIAITLLVDLLIRLTNLKAHYTNQGILPLDALFRFGWNDYFFSFYTISGAPLIQVIIFTLNFISILFLLVGYRTKLFTILCWLFLLSLHNRNVMIHQGGDDLLRLAMFWGMFLPWNYYYSIDSLNMKNELKPVSITSLAAFAFMLQVAYVYFFSAILKSSGEWRSEYTALYYALSLDSIVLPIGRLIYPYENFLKIITMLVFYIEFFVPMLLLIPVLTNYFRMAFIIMIVGLHVGISLCLNVGLFPLIGCVTLIVLLPGNITAKITGFFSSINWSALQKFIPNIFSSENRNIYVIPTENNYQRVFVIFFSIYVLNWNLGTIKAANLSSYLRNEVAFVLRLDQHWGMFSPCVFKDDGWFVFAARTKENKEIDILQRGTDVNYQKMTAVAPPFTEDRWRKFSENIIMIVNDPYRPYYCDYLMNQWNNRQDSEKTKITSLQIIYMKEMSLPNYQIQKPSKEVLCECRK